MALLTVRITSEDGTVRELKLEPGAQIEVAEGDKVEILDSDGRPIEILADGDDVIVTIVAEQQQTVIIDGIVRGGGGAEEEEFIFENLALYIEDETGSSISFFDPDTEEITVVASIEDLLAGISTAAGETGDAEGTFGASGGEADPTDPNLTDPLGTPTQDPPIAINFDPPADQTDAPDPEAPPIVGISLVTAGGGDGEGNIVGEDALEGGFIAVTATIDIAPSGTPLVLTLSPTGTLGDSQDDFTVTILPGEFSGSTSLVAQSDDVFIDPSTETFSVIGATGGCFTDLLASVTGGATDSEGNPTVSVDVNDTINTVTATLTDSLGDGSNEDAGSITYVVTLTGTDGFPVAPTTQEVFTFTLTNGQEVEVAVEAGQTSGDAFLSWSSGGSDLNGLANPDVYVDPLTITVDGEGMTSTNNSGYEDLDLAIDEGIGETVPDSIDTTVVTLNDVSVNEDQTFTYTASVDSAPQGAFSVTLNNGVVINFADGDTTGESATQAAQGDDVFVDNASSSVSISSTEGGNYESLNTSSTSTVTISDTTNTVTATLTDSLGDGSNEDAGSITYVVTLTGTDGFPVAPTTQEVFTFTLTNGQEVEVAVEAGQTSGDAFLSWSSGGSDLNGLANPDVYVDPLTITVDGEGMTSTNNSGYEDLDLAIDEGIGETVPDSIDTTVVTLNDVSVNEDETITYTASVNNPTDGAFSVTLDNGVVIDFADGDTTGTSSAQAAQCDDVYVDGESFGVSIASTSGGNFEALDLTDTATVTISDTDDTTTVTLDDVSVNEDQTITYTASLSNVDGVGPQGAFSVTLDNGVVIDFADGDTTGTSSAQAAQGDDVYVDGESFGVSIASTSGGNFEALDLTDTATVTISDTIDEVVATLTADVSSIGEGGGNIVYTVTLSHASLDVTGHDGVSFTLTNPDPDGAPIVVTIAGTFASGQVTVPIGPEDIDDNTGSFANSIASVSGDSEFENLTTTGSTDVDIDYGVDIDVGAGVTVDEDDLLAARGADEADGSDSIKESTTQGETFTITAPDGVATMTIDGFTIISGGSLVGSPTFTTTDMGNTFTVTAYNSSTGLVTYEYELLDDETHASGAGGNNLLETLAVVVTDNDGSVNDPANLTVTIVDDVPIGIFAETIHAENVANATPVEFQLNFVAGADGIGSVVFTDANLGPALDNDDTQLQLDGELLFLVYGDDGNDTTQLVAQTAGGTVAFVIDIDPTDGTGTFTFMSTGVIDNGSAVTATDLSSVGGGNTAVKALIDLGGTDQDVLLTTVDGETLNTNANEIGIGQGNDLDPMEAVRIDLVNDLSLVEDVVVVDTTTAGKAQGGGTDEIQTITVTATAGTYTLSFDDPTNVTGPIAFNATDAEVEAAIEGLTGITDVDVTEVGGVYTITFLDPGATNVDELVASSPTGMIYTDHNTTTAFRQFVNLPGAGTLRADFTLFAILADDDQLLYNDPPSDGDPEESFVDLSASNINIYDDLGALIDPDDYASLDVDVDGSLTNGVLITGMRDGWEYQIVTDADNEFSAVQIDATGDTDAFKLGGFTYGLDDPGDPVAVSYVIEGTDGDGDTVAGTIDAALYPDAVTETGTSAGETLTGTDSAEALLGLGGDDRLEGLGGDDVLIGDGGMDTLIGGAGDDVLFGGSSGDMLTGDADEATDGTADGDVGADRFVIEGSDIAAPANVGGDMDTITDFGTTADVLDLSDIFADANVDSATVLTGFDSDSNVNTSGYLEFSQNGADAEVRVDVTGGGNFDGGAVVVLLNTDATTLDTTSNVDV